jgi:hypothetical protein
MFDKYGRPVTAQQVLDQYGRPLTGIELFDGQGRPLALDGFGRVIPPMVAETTARVSMPTVGQMGGQGVSAPPWVRFPFFPTAPYYSTNPNVTTQVRFYSTGILSSDSDVSVGSETIRTVTFDIPVRVIAINGSCVNTNAAGAAMPVGTDQRDCFLFRIEYGTGDKLHTAARLGSTVLGTMGNPGEMGGVGYTVDQGGALTVGITPINPIPATFRIDITFHCLEVRASSNFVNAGR